MFYVVAPSELALDETDSKPDYMNKFGLPMFFVLIIGEWILLQFRDALRPASENKPSGYRLNDFVMSVALGTFQAMFLLLLAVVGLEIELGFYTYAYDHFRIWTIEAKENVLATYFGLLLGKDLCYYAAHRFFHEYHLAWIGHSNHHSGEDYNLGTALRQGALQPVFGWPFYLPLAVLGFHPNAFAGHAQLNTLFMFWIHTDLIGRLGWLEYIINTPSSHRMHHRPPGNCNYAGALIIWDRMFDTYTPEIVRKDFYGNGNQPNTFDPVKLNAHHLKQIRRVGGTRDGGKSCWYKMCARRVRKRRRVHLAGLVEPIPPIAKDVRSTGPKRKKWDGAQAMDLASKLWFALFGVASLVGAVALLVQAESMDRLDTTCGAMVSCLLFSSLGKVADRDGSLSLGSAKLLTAVLTLVLYGIAFAKPFGTMHLELADYQVKSAAGSCVLGLMALGATTSTRAKIE